MALHALSRKTCARSWRAAISSRAGCIRAVKSPAATVGSFPRATATGHPNNIKQASWTNGCSQPQTSAKITVFDKLGGRDAVVAAVDIFYNKVLADDRVNRFFKNTDMKKQRAKQMAFMTFAFGGEESWKGRPMYEAHEHLDLDESHFGAIAENFIATLQELNVPKDAIDEAVAVLVSVKPQVLGFMNPNGPAKKAM